MTKKIAYLTLSMLILAACSGSAAKPKSDPNRFFADFGRGVDSLDRKDYATAIHSLSLAIAEQPRSTKALNLRGVAYLMSGKVNEAKADFAMAIQVDPAYGSAYQNLGCALVKERKLVEAEAVLRQALQRSPASASACFTLGSVLVLLGRGEEALAAMRRGLELDPDYLGKEQKFATGSGLQEENSPELFFSYARLFAATGDVGRTVEFLQRAKKAGFRAWERIATLSDFDAVRDDPALKEFLK